MPPTPCFSSLARAHCRADLADPSDPAPGSLAPISRGASCAPVSAGPGMLHTTTKALLVIFEHAQHGQHVQVQGMERGEFFDFNHLELVAVACFTAPFSLLAFLLSFFSAPSRCASCTPVSAGAGMLHTTAQPLLVIFEHAQHGQHVQVQGMERGAFFYFNHLELVAVACFTAPFSCLAFFLSSSFAQSLYRCSASLLFSSFRQRA